jgi:hypothetical protein
LFDGTTETFEMHHVYFYGWLGLVEMIDEVSADNHSCDGIVVVGVVGQLDMTAE